MPGPPEGFSIDEQLAVYGSLAPGERNAHVLAPLVGEWTEGEIIGTLQTITEGYAAGYQGIRLDGGDAVPCMLFSSRDLPAFWAHSPTSGARIWALLLPGARLP